MEAKESHTVRKLRWQTKLFAEKYLNLFSWPDVRINSFTSHWLNWELIRKPLLHMPLNWKCIHVHIFHYIASNLHHLRPAKFRPPTQLMCLLGPLPILNFSGVLFCKTEAGYELHRINGNAGLIPDLEALTPNPTYHTPEWFKRARNLQLAQN